MTRFLAQNQAINDNSDVYIGLVAWGAGSFKTDYILSLTPTLNNGQWVDTDIMTECVLASWTGDASEETVSSSISPYTTATTVTSATKSASSNTAAEATTMSTTTSTISQPSASSTANDVVSKPSDNAAASKMTGKTTLHLFLGIAAAAYFV